jgi:hypothetical protein
VHLNEGVYNALAIPVDDLVLLQLTRFLALFESLSQFVALCGAHRPHVGVLEHSGESETILGPFPIEHRLRD